MKRRHVVALPFGMALAGPRTVLAQPAQRVYRVGLVLPTSAGARSEAFLAGMKALGYTEGHNVKIEMRFADGQADRLPGLVAEVLQQKVDVLVVGSTIGARAAKNASSTIPIVFAGSSDPVAGGIVTNLARPEANITGFSLAFGDGFAGKWLELLKEVSPRVTQFAVLWSSSNPAAARFVKELQTMARTLNLRLDAHLASTAPELDASLAAIASSAARGLIVMPSPFAVSKKETLVQFAANRRLPAIYFVDEFAIAGGLMTYGPSVTDSYRRAATHVDKILKGAKPADLPVEQPTRFELVINLKAAKALDLTIPQSLLLRADEVIQ